MLKSRIIPCLLLSGNGFVKTKKFKNPTYLGDPINIVHIFNEKEVDEIVILDIDASNYGKPINMELLQNIATECFIPMSYGGGVRNIEDARKLNRIGYEKIVVNSVIFENPQVIFEMKKILGSQSIVASIDVKKNLLGKYKVFTKSGTQSTGLNPIEVAKIAVDLGVGEILLTSIDRDGTYQGYDMDLIEQVANSVDVPVIASGGASSTVDLINVIKFAGASAAAACSIFVFHGPLHGVLINMPSIQELSFLENELKKG